MSTTPNLLIPHIAAAQNQKEVTANYAFDKLDIGLTDYLAIAMPDATYTMSTVAGGEALGHLVFVFTGALTGNRNIVVPTNKKLYIVSNQTSGGHTITVKTPSGTGIALSTTDYRLLYCDGTNVVSLASGGAGATIFTGLGDVPGSYSGASSNLVEVNSGGTALVFTPRPYKFGGFVNGTFSASQVLAYIPVDEAVAFAADFTNTLASQAVLLAATTATTVFAIFKNSTQIGTITFTGAGATVGVVETSSHAAQSMTAGQVFKIVAPASPDATAAGLGFVIRGTF